MGFSLELYFCYHCRKHISDLKDVLLVDSSHLKSFCSEKCIEGFYKPYVNYFQQYERDQRSALGLTEKNENYENEIKECMSKPDKIYRSVNDIEESVYFAHRKNPETNLITIIGVLMYQGRPSFIFFSTSTKSDELARVFVIGEPLSIDEILQEEHEYEEEVEEEKQEEDLEFQKFIELKKSQQLARLIENIQENDLGIDNYPLYDKFLQPTLENPDEVYEFSDEDDDKLYTYIKAFNEGDISFFYVCVSHLYDTDPEKDQDVLIPVISFPTIDKDLYHGYQSGEQIVGPTKN